MRGFHRGGRHQLGVNAVQFQAAVALGNGFCQRFDAVILRAVGNLGIEQQHGRLRFVAVGIRHADVVALQRLLRGDFNHAALEFALVVLKGFNRRCQPRDADKFIRWRVFDQIAQRQHLPHHGQRGGQSLIRLHAAAAFKLRAQQRHAAFGGGYAIGFQPLHHIGAFLPVVIRYHQQGRHVLLRGRLRQDDVCAQQPRVVVAQHGGIHQTRVQRAHGSVHVGNRVKQFILFAR